MDIKRILRSHQRLLFLCRIIQEPAMQSGVWFKKLSGVLGELDFIYCLFVIVFVDKFVKSLFYVFCMQWQNVCF